MNKPGVCVIVDAFSSGFTFALELIRRGYNCINLCSSKKIVANPTINKEVFLDILFYNNLQQTIESLKDYDVIAIFPGLEGPGVRISNILSQHYNLCGNDPNTSEQRKNKYYMGQALLEKGLRAIKQVKIEKLEELLSGINYINKYPIIIKPLTGGNTEDVYICENEGQIRERFINIIDKTNICSFKNTAALLQEYIDGDEYIINTVSYQDKIYVSDIWEYEKKRIPGNTPVCLSCQMINYDKTKHEEMLLYSNKVLSCLGIQYGPAHNEVMIDKNGPVLIESGARLMGGAIKNSVLKDCLGYTQIDATIDCQLNLKDFKNHCNIGYQIRQHFKVINLMSHKEGILKNIHHLNMIRNLPSYKSEVINIKEGQKIYDTVDGKTCPGHIILSHKSSELIAEDYAKIREYEKTMFELA